MYSLTKQDLKCIKNADYICFDYLNENGQNVSQIRCNVEGKNSSTGYLQTHLIECDSRFEIYVDKPNYKYQVSTMDKPKRCYDSISHPKSDNHWESIRPLIRENDSIILQWHSNSEGYLRGSTTTIESDNGGYIAYKERLFYDKLSIIIAKPNGKRLEFWISFSICPDNSARMIKGVKA